MPEHRNTALGEKIDHRRVMPRLPSSRPGPGFLKDVRSGLKGLLRGLFIGTKGRSTMMQDLLMLSTTPLRCQA